MSRSHSFFENKPMPLLAHMNAEDFSSDEEDGIEVSAIFSTQNDSHDAKAKGDQVALLFASPENLKKTSQKKLIAKNSSGLYVLVSPVKSKKPEAEKKLETKAWKSGCACAIL